VDGSLVEVQIIEEWGFDLGDDACLLADDEGSKASLVADDDCWEDPEACNHVDILVDKLAKGVVDVKYHDSQGQGTATQSVKPPDKSQSLDLGDGEGGRAHDGLFNTVLEPVAPDTGSGTSIARVAETEMTDPPVVNGPKISAAKSAPEQRKRTASCPPARRPGRSGPWSLDWLQDNTSRDAGVVPSTKKSLKKGCGAGGGLHKTAAQGPLMKQDGGFLRNSLFSLKRIARLPINDRREVMQLMQKKARRRKQRGVARRTTGSRASGEGVTSSSSVNNDWKHWVAMQGNDCAVEEDVLEVGKAIGATFKGDKANMFSVLSRAGSVKRDTLSVAQVGDSSKERGG
jgi:hypothetical protein